MKVILIHVNPTNYKLKYFYPEKCNNIKSVMDFVVSLVCFKDNFTQRSWETIKMANFGGKCFQGWDLTCLVKASSKSWLPLTCTQPFTYLRIINKARFLFLFNNFPPAAYLLLVSIKWQVRFAKGSMPVTMYCNYFSPSFHSYVLLADFRTDDAYTYVKLISYKKILIDSTTWPFWRLITWI